MEMKMKVITRVILALTLTTMALTLIGESGFAQTMKIGFVRDENIKKGYPAWVKAEEQWRTETKAWEDEALAKQEELQQLSDEYEKQRLILSDEKKREKEAAINAKQEALDAFTRQIYGPNGTAERKHAQLLDPLLESISNAIEAVAIEGGYDVIFTLQSGLGYIKEEYDITDKVIKHLEESTN
ncbi:MAG: OmpH family outer membrane protein [Candidatus Zixiibacteriota bacterium]